LNVGDVVTFGHLGGHTVAPGQLAPKQPAEFQFLVSFLCILHNNLNVTSIIITGPSTHGVGGPG